MIWASLSPEQVTNFILSRMRISRWSELRKWEWEYRIYPEKMEDQLLILLEEHGRKYQAHADIDKIQTWDLSPYKEQERKQILKDYKESLDNSAISQGIIDSVYDYSQTAQDYYAIRDFLTSVKESNITKFKYTHELAVSSNNLHTWRVYCLGVQDSSAFQAKAYPMEEQQAILMQGVRSETPLSDPGIGKSILCSLFDDLLTVLDPGLNVRIPPHYLTQYACGDLEEMMQNAQDLMNQNKLQECSDFLKAMLIQIGRMRIRLNSNDYCLLQEGVADYYLFFIGTATKEPGYKLSGERALELLTRNPDLTELKPMIDALRYWLKRV